MARDCKGICDNDPMFTKTRLPANKGSYCSNCEKSYKNPIHWLHGAIIELLPNPWDLITRYYDTDGKRKNVRIFRPIKYLVRQEYCKCCGTKFRAGPLSKTGSQKDYIKSDRRVGRPRGPDKEKEEIDYWVEEINRTKDTVYQVDLEDVPPHLQSKVKKRIEKDNETKTSHAN